MNKIEEVEKIIGKIEAIKRTPMAILYLGKEKVVKEFMDKNFSLVDLRPLARRQDVVARTVEIDAVYCKDLRSRAVKIADIPMVLMRRFDSSGGLDKLYVQGKVTKEHAIQIGVLFAKAHIKARTNKQISEIGYKAISSNWEELFVTTKDIAKAIDRTIPQANYQKIVNKIRKYISTNTDYMKMRRDSGFIRQCHGDGHAGNMFIEDGLVKIFDGMGLKAEYSYADVIADVAFAVMDALAHGRLDVAEEIKTSYTKRSGDIEGVERLLNFYICYRAFVRGQVSTMISNGMENEEKEKMLKSARKYYDLAVKYPPDAGEVSVVPKG